MVRVRFRDRKGKTWTASFPKITLAEVRTSAKKINPRISKVEYAKRRRKTRKSAWAY